jgi:hypothetical protein
MTTEKERLSSDIDSMQEGFEKLFAASADKRQLVLQSHEDSDKAISEKQSDFLRGLGFNSLKNVQEFEERSKELQKVGITMETIDELKKIKDTYGKNIISYDNLCKLCEKYNLYFGDSSLFTDVMPMENVKELETFPFGKFSSHYTVCHSYHEESIVEGRVSTKAQAMIVAPLNLFKLENVFVSKSRELIPFSGVNSKCKSKGSDDPIVILPFKTRGVKEIFFLIITHWDNSKSII